MTKKLNLAVFISGRGSNLQSLIDACQNADFPARITLVLSNKPDAYGLQRAAQAGIPTCVVDHKNYAGREAFEDALQDALQQHSVDLICLAGFMRILTAGFVQPWEGRMINIHPSLLPAYKGLDTHARAIQAGEKYAGCSVHYVTPGMDEGPIIIQRAVPIEAQDTAETLSARILPEEHIAYPEAVRMIANGKVRYNNGMVLFL